MRVLACLVLFLGFAGWAGADVPPPYTPYSIGAGMDEGEPFPTITSVAKGGPAAKAGVKVGDQVIAVNGVYSKTRAPFYFFARGLQGPRNTFVRLILLRNESEVLVINVKRTVRS
jgi:C-terminal processing protease CtpA/Prc